MIEYKTVSLADQVYERLEANILNGTYKIGEILSESKLSEELGVSRTPIREAVARLSYENLIKETPSGSLVLGISLKDVDDLFEVKMRIELLCTRWAAENISDEGIKALEAIIAQQEYFAKMGDAKMVRNLDTEFHDMIYQECGSRVMESILSSIHHKLMKYRQASLEIENRIMDSVDEHRKICQALKEHDQDRVDSLMMVHIEHAYNSIIEVTRKEQERQKREQAL